ncbi:MAG: radical SAM protein [Elusimicrobia bacterium]|nr:radical SAM protein [Elusimicrobiota bacterium]
MRTAGHIRRLFLLYRIFARRAGAALLPRLAGFAWRRYLLGRRVPLTVMIAVTCRCQCDCAHCSASGLTDGGAELSTGEIKDIIDGARQIGSPKVGFTGGEPLLRQDMVELTAYASSLGLSVSMDTNGLFLDEKKARELRAAGLSNINVSLDSPEARRHDRLRNFPGCFDAALQAVKTCAGLGLPCVVSTYITDRGLAEGRFAALIELARSSGAMAVRALFPIYTGKLGGRSRSLLSAEHKRLFFEKYADPSFVYSESPLYDYLGGTMQCTAQKNISVYVGADGAVRSCYVSKVSLGNVRDGGLAAVLERSGYFSAGAGAGPDCGACG